MLGEPGKGSHVGCMAPKAQIFVDAWVVDAYFVVFLLFPTRSCVGLFDSHPQKILDKQFHIPHLMHRISLTMQFSPNVF